MLLGSHKTSYNGKVSPEPDNEHLHNSSLLTLLHSDKTKNRLEAQGSKVVLGAAWSLVLTGDWGLSHLCQEQDYHLHQ